MMNGFIKWATNRWLLGLAAAVMIYALIGFSLVPFLVRHYTPRLAADLLKRQASVGEVQFNPFLFTFEARDFFLNEADGQPIAGLRRLFLDFEPTSLVTRRTYAFADLRIEEPAMNLVLDPEGKLNLAKIAESLPETGEPAPPPPEEPPPRIFLNHMELADGSVKYTDLTKPAPVTETVEHLDLKLNGISTLPDRTGTHWVEAQLPDGGRLAWRGDVSLNPVASSGELAIESLRLATLWKFAKDRLNLAEPAGAIRASARYQFSHGKDKTELTVNEAAAKLAGLELAAADAKAPLLKLEEIGFEKASVDLAEHAVRVPAFVLRKGEVQVSVGERGEMNWLALVKPEPAKAAPGPSPPGPSWRVAVESLRIAEVGIRYADASRTSPFLVSIGDFGLELGAEAEAGAGAPKARIDKLAAHANQVALTRPGNPAPLFGWDSLALEGGRLDLEKREAAIERAMVKGGGATLVREEDGTLHPIEMFAPKDAGAPAADEKKNQPPEEQAWRFALDEFTLQGFGVALADRSFSPELAYNLDDVQAAVKNITSDGNTPVAFDTSLKVRQGGAVQVSGTASPKGDSAQAKVRIDRFDLKPLQPVVSRFAELKLEGADLSTDLDVEFRRGEPNPSVKASGGANLNGLRLTQTRDNKRFLAWKTLAVNGLDFSLEPDKLAIKEVRVAEPGATITIFQDRSTNIAAVIKPQKPEPAAPPAKPAKSAPAASRPFPATVERVRVDDGQVDFSDLSLVLPFSTRIHDFDGSVVGISTAARDRATLKFEGQVGQYGTATVNGSLRPMEMKEFSNIEVEFRNVAMPPFSPYSATFAGRKIRSGKLDLDLQYRIENHQLKSENKIVLENFTLGERVESPSALDLPLDLAIALLTDSRGRINASVPVSGSVDDPKFSYGKLVWDAVATLLKKAVTAPFTALASVFGGNGGKLDAVLFEPGHEAIPPPEREKLKKIAEALAQRPKLKLTVHGRFNPRLDGEALRSLRVRLALARKLDVEPEPGEDPGAVAFDSAATQRALEELADERGGPKAIETVQAEYRKKTGKPPQRVGALAGFFGRASETPDFYEKLFEHLVSIEPLPQSELETLAGRRGTAVAAELADRQRLDRARVAAGKIESTGDSADGKVPTRLELGAD
jgi:uncharacterized protein involved in outer membrane biogenesis